MFPQYCLRRKIYDWIFKSCFLIFSRFRLHWYFSFAIYKIFYIIFYVEELLQIFPLRIPLNIEQITGVIRSRKTENRTLEFYFEKKKKGEGVLASPWEMVKNFQRRRCLSSTCPIDHSRRTRRWVSLTHHDYTYILYTRQYNTRGSRRRGARVLPCITRARIIMIDSD